MILAAMALIFTAALAGVGASSVGLLFYAGRAMNRARPGQTRAAMAALAAGCLAGIVLSAGAGFWGIGALLYAATR